jgi:tetratricopeptide (TPR) repeat protein
VLKRDTVGAFESRLRRHARWKWLGPSLAAAIVFLAVAGTLAVRRRADPGVARARAEALALVALDDAVSVEGGIARLDGELRRSARNAQAAGDRALAQVVRAAALVDEGEGLAARLAGRSAERERLRRDQPDGWESAERGAAEDVRTLEADVRAREEKARALCGSALDALRALQRDAGDRVEVLRGLAAYYALGGERERALKVVRSARERGLADGWIDLAEAWTEARDPDRASRERALVKLGAVAAAHPELLRARFVLARSQASLGRRGEALATLEGLLAANPRHEGAKRVKAELLTQSAPPSFGAQAISKDSRPRSEPQAPVSRATTQDASAPSAPPAPENEVALPRNPVAQHAVPRVRSAEPSARGAAAPPVRSAEPPMSAAGAPRTPAVTSSAPPAAPRPATSTGTPAGVSAPPARGPAPSATAATTPAAAATGTPPAVRAPSARGSASIAAPAATGPASATGTPPAVSAPPARGTAPFATPPGSPQSVGDAGPGTAPRQRAKVPDPAPPPRDVERRDPSPDGG